jgi:hypothetical protein
MGIVEAKIQTVEEIYRLVWAAVANGRPIAASYHEFTRLFCPHRLAGTRKAKCVYCAISTAERAKADLSRRVPRPTGLHCTGEARKSEVAGRWLAHSAKSFTPCILHHQT